MKVCYISDDGKSFTSLKDCEEYEKTFGYEVEIFENGKNILLRYFIKKQDCQHFVANYIHTICKHERLNTEEFSNYIITVRHKDVIECFKLIELLEEVPAHYKINSNQLNKLIK